MLGQSSKALMLNSRTAELARVCARRHTLVGCNRLCTYHSRQRPALAIPPITLAACPAHAWLQQLVHNDSSACWCMLVTVDTSRCTANSSAQELHRDAFLPGLLALFLFLLLSHSLSPRDLPPPSTSL